MDMNVNIYLPDELGERVKKSDLEVSRICQGALAREVEAAEAERAAKRKTKLRRIEVRVGDDEHPWVTKAFQGEWLIENFEFKPKNWPAGGGDPSWSVGLTKGGNFAVLCETEYGDAPVSGEAWLMVFASLDEASKKVPQEVVAAAASRIGVDRVIELDI